MGIHTTASHLAVVLLRESYLGDRHLYHTLWVRAGLISKRTEEGPAMPSTHCAQGYVQPPSVNLTSRSMSLWPRKLTLHFCPCLETDWSGEF